MKIAVIGAGIAGQMIVHQLIKQDLKLSALDWYSAESFSPACSFSSTSIVRKAGITQGVSELGDLLHQSFIDFEAQFSNSSEFSDAIDLGSHYQLGNKDNEQFLKRYNNMTEESIFSFSGQLTSEEKAYFIDPQQMSVVICQKFQSMEFATQFENQLVLDIRERADLVEVQTMEQSLNYDYVYIATGWNYQSTPSFGAQFRNHLSGHYIELSGDFLEQTYRDKSWSLSAIDEINYIYRLKTNKLLISPFNQKTIDLLGSPTQLAQLYELAKKNFPQWSWPKLQKENLKVGVRLKGIQRKPTAKWQTPRIAILNGLYKNGFSFSVKLAKDLVNVMGKEKR